ncbi:hypothetical protein A2811_00410 [Candidatus Campbellbacteria bacterium RIFCSPHIGHO2_01_FULL_34_10]|uniref:Uncharacterized protein n=1 Tax=Candidatus Campbellbacteria bacterium RIFCSPHIGHO2_01_FULL_34_10 TaxID=1797577 RepID=A0A1F5ELQ5_9BACT|nr:MAG: hypothetical protein A2811_00410 [Candidatus Campbellbacteria bacterium RIFCSPHIGHO2_01_FULL_34_10]
MQQQKISKLNAEQGVKQKFFDLPASRQGLIQHKAKKIFVKTTMLCVNFGIFYTNSIIDI